MFTRLRQVIPSGAPADWQKVLAVIFIWGGAVVFALSRITQSSIHNPRLWMVSTYDVRHGYTFSLVLLALPLAALVWWYVLSRKSDHDNRLQTLMRAVLIDAAVVGLVFVLFDAVFATLLFSFPDPSATFPARFWGYRWADECSTFWTIYKPSCYAKTIPYEEVVFYLGGAAVLRGMYVWASEDFLSLYTMKHEDYVEAAKRVDRLLAINWTALVVTLGILAAGIVVKQVKDPQGGYPVYLMLQALIVASPVVFLYTKVSVFINTRALLMVMVLQVFVSVIWEATAAIPYGWWDYRPAALVGIPVRPWADLPIEACFFWITVGWSAMFAHEATKIRVRSGRGWREILFPRSVPPPIALEPRVETGAASPSD